MLTENTKFGSQVTGVLFFSSSGRALKCSISIYMHHTHYELVVNPRNPARDMDGEQRGFLALKTQWFFFIYFSAFSPQHVSFVLFTAVLTDRRINISRKTAPVKTACLEGEYVPRTTA